MITITEAAELTDVHRNTVLKWIKTGKIEFERQPISGWKLLDKEAVLKLDKERKAKR